MAILWMEGFDVYNDITDVLRNPIYSVDATTGWNVSSGRISGNCIQSPNTREIYVDFPESTNTHWINVALYFGESQTSAQPLIDVYDTSGNYLWRIYTDANNKFEFRRGSSTVLGTSTNSIPTNVWINVSVEVYIHDTAGTVTLKVNDQPQITLTSQDTKDGSSTTTNRLRLLKPLNMGTVYFDDVVFGDNSGSDLTAYPGDMHIEMLTVDGNGNTNNWTVSNSGSSNYQMVDETPADNDTTYVYSSTATDKELYTLSNLTATADTFYAVQVRTKARKELAGFREINNTMRSSTSESDGPAAAVGVDLYQWVDWINENDPNGGVNWTESAINALEVGVELKT